MEISENMQRGQLRRVQKECQNWIQPFWVIIISQVRHLTFFHDILLQSSWCRISMLFSGVIFSNFSLRQMMTSSGSVPEGNPSLLYIDLSYNSFSGQVTTQTQLLTQMSYLGEISSEFPDIRWHVSDFSHNLLSGHLPAQVGFLKSVKYMDFSYNKLWVKIRWVFARNFAESS